MDLVLCHTTADFDTLGAAVGVACLRPGTRIVLTGGAHPTVQAFLALWRDEYPLIERRAVNFAQVRSLTLVDAHQRDRFTPVIDWIEQAEQKDLPIYIYDHHAPQEGAKASISPDIPSARSVIEVVGAATTLIVEQLQGAQRVPTPSEATVMALGIHSDSGSLTFESATARDATALAWLMDKGANQQAIAEYRESGLSPVLQDLLAVALETIEVENVRGHQLGWVKLETGQFVPGLSGLAGQLIDLTDVDTLLLFSSYQAHGGQKDSAQKAVVIGRSRTRPFAQGGQVDLRPIFSRIGGGGHAQAASAVLGGKELAELEDVFEEVLDEVRSQIPGEVLARSLMSSPVRTILPDTTVSSAQDILLRYGHTGLCVVDETSKLVGIVSRRDIDIALRHSLGHIPVKGCMSVQIKSIAPETPASEIQELMTTYDIGRLPVLDSESLVGIVTRTDLLRFQRQQTPKVSQSSAKQTQRTSSAQSRRPPDAATLYQTLENRISEIWPALMLIADVAQRKGWALYVVGGAVRDLLLGLVPNPIGEPQALTDIDLVVDGAGEGAGVALAEALQAKYPAVSVQIHGQFQTASLVWHSTDQRPAKSQSNARLENADAHAKLASAKSNSAELEPAKSEPLLIDIATARTEFYPYPAANPEVEASSIRQDLYRRDFAMNAIAIKLNEALDGAPAGSLLDFFGGWLDLQHCHVRVLHPNSFIEDPTRIFRAVRFAVRLEFSIEDQTERFIRAAISSGVYDRMRASEDKTPALQARLKTELKYLLKTERWEAALQQIDRLGALACIHPDLQMTPSLWRQLRRMDRWLSRFDARQSDIRQLAISQPANYVNKKPHAVLNVDVPRWLLLLELIVAQLPSEAAAQTAINLDLGDSSLYRLKNLHAQEARLIAQLGQANRPSQVYSLLKGYKIGELLLASDRHPYTLGAQIWQYMLRLSQIPPLLNGNQLKKLGLQPGPQFRDILSVLHQLTLDGELMTSEDAERYVIGHYYV